MLIKRLSFVSPNQKYCIILMLLKQAVLPYTAPMIAKILSAIPHGYQGRLIEVEGDCNRGLPAFNIVGMANKTIEESKDRVRAALHNSTFSFPDTKVTINLAPADLHKDGAYLDLPIALAVMVLSNQLPQIDLDNKLFVGELSLTGELRPVRGIINIVETAKHANIHEIFIPQSNLLQASLVSGINIIGVPNLKSLFLHLKGEIKIATPHATTDNPKPNTNPILLDHIHGQQQAKRAMTIAIAGRHNILISGPPGAGKTMLAKAALNLLPNPSNTEKVAITKIHSLSGITQDIVHYRPFRNPHHTASPISLIGGGPLASPGEISLAHLGVLFLDELPEYPRNVLEALRQPLEDKQISISRTNQKTTYPADFMLIATMNPCPCGFLGSYSHECICTPTQLLNYTKKLSGPLLDRIDIIIDVAQVENTDLLKSPTDSSASHDAAKSQIITAIKNQRKRYQKTDLYNSSLSSSQVSKQLHLSPSAKRLLEHASKSLDLSARAYFKVIKVAGTISDLESAHEITDAHLSEALQYRKK